jgi:hypothetical protein
MRRKIFNGQPKVTIQEIWLAIVNLKIKERLMTCRMVIKRDSIIASDLKFSK